MTKKNLNLSIECSTMEHSKAFLNDSSLGFKVKTTCQVTIVSTRNTAIQPIS